MNLADTPPQNSRFVSEVKDQREEEADRHNKPVVQSFILKE